MLCPIKVFYCDIHNFGDQLNVDLYRHYGYEPEWVESTQAEVILAGSIIAYPGDAFRGVVLGAGLIHADFEYALPHANVIAVRGPLTLARISRSPIGMLLGDPGIFDFRIVSLRRT